MNYPPGVLVASSTGRAWSGVTVSLFSLETAEETFSMPAIREPMLVWIVKGQAETGECEPDRGMDWSVQHVRQDSLFLTAAGAPYDFFWRRRSVEPLEVLMTVFEAGPFEAALRAEFGQDASMDSVSVRDLSNFDDRTCVELLGVLRRELLAISANPGVVAGISSALCSHIARRFCVLSTDAKRAQGALPSAKLRRAKRWLEDNLDKEFSLAALAEQADLSEFHFSRQFRSAVGVPPSKYHAQLRIDLAKRLLRETSTSILDVGLHVGYANPSHFSRIFKRETGVTPRQFRRADGA